MKQNKQRLIINWTKIEFGYEAYKSTWVILPLRETKTKQKMERVETCADLCIIWMWMLCSGSPLRTAFIVNICAEKWVQIELNHLLMTKSQHLLFLFGSFRFHLPHGKRETGRKREHESKLYVLLFSSDSFEIWRKKHVHTENIPYSMNHSSYFFSVICFNCL